MVDSSYYFHWNKLQFGNNFSVTDDEKEKISSSIDSISQHLVNIVQAEQWEKSAQAILRIKQTVTRLKNRLMAALASA